MPEDPRLTRAREQLRKAPPTFFQSTGTMGGPGQEAGLAEAERRQVVAKEEPTRLFETGVEMGVGLAAGAAVGPVAGRAAGMATRPLTRYLVNTLIRGTAVGAGQLGPSELMAPSEETPSEANVRRAVSFGSGLGGEMAAPIVQRGLHRVLSPMARALRRPEESLLTPGAVKAQELMQEFGETLTPAQVRRSHLLRTVENVATDSFLGGGVMHRTQEGAANAAVEALERATGRLADTLDHEHVGILLDEALNNSALLQRSFTSAAYKAVDEKIANLGGFEGPKLHAALRGAEELFEHLEQVDDPVAKSVLGLLSKGAPTREVLDAAGSRVRIDELPISFEMADKIRSSLLALRRSDKELIPGTAALASKVAKDVDEAINVAGIRMGPMGREVVDALTMARETSRFGKEVFGNPMIANLIGKASPEQLAQAVFANQRPTTIRAIREIIENPKFRDAVGDPEAVWLNLQNSWVSQARARAGEEVVEGATRETFGELSGRKMSRLISQYGGSFRELFTRAEQRESIITAARALEISQSKALATRSGSVYIQLAQAGAVSTGMMGLWGEPGFGAHEGIILLGPAALAQLLSRPSFTNWMIRRAQTRVARTGETSGRMMAQLVSRVVAERVPFVFQDKRGEKIPYDPSMGDIGVPSKNPFKPTSKMP